MTQLSYDRYCDEIIRQTALLMSAVTDADLTAPVPSCPGWTTGRLLRHVGDVQRWAGSTVASRATGPRRVERSRDRRAGCEDEPAVLGSWLASGAQALAGALREAGPGTPVWTPVPGGTTDFYAPVHPRGAHEKAAVAVRGPLTGLLLVIYQRRPARGGGIEVFGDAALLDFWLERVSFG